MTKNNDEYETHWRNCGIFRPGDVVRDIDNKPVPKGSKDYQMTTEKIKSSILGKLGRAQVQAVLMLTPSGFAVPKHAKAPLEEINTKPTLHCGSIIAILPFITDDKLNRVFEAVKDELSKRSDGQSMVCMICRERTTIVDGAYKCICDGKLKVPGL